jgi:hypothetical protein
MADRHRIAASLALVVALIVLALAPATALGAMTSPRPVDRILVADAPDTNGEDCVDDPNAHPGVGLRQCPTPFTAASLLPYVAGGVVVLLALAAGWYLVMRRRVSRPFLADETAGGSGAGDGGGGPGSGAPSDEWWTCSTCGSSNLVGSARCYKCGSWQR